MESIPKKSGIYQIRNLVNGKVYVGSAVNLNARKNKHFKHLRLHKHHSIKLQRAYDKYGEHNLIFEILEFVPNQGELIQREQYYIDHLNAVNEGYNICPTAGNMLGFKHSDNSKSKMSKYRKGRPLSESCKQHMSQSRKGHIVSKETRKKLSEANKGTKPAQTTLEAMYKPVQCIETGQTFCSIKEANKWLGVKRSHISACCKGTRLTVSGYHWKYVD